MGARRNHRACTRVEESSRPTFPFWSPDGKYIGFFSAGKLKKVALAGGPVQILCDAPEGRGASWSQRGVIIFTPNIFEPLYKVPEGGGTPERITEAQPGWTHRNPYFLPDGDHFLFIAREHGRGQHGPARVRCMARRSPARSRARYWSAPRTCSIPRDTSCTCAKPCWWRSASILNRCKFSGDPKPVAEKLDYWNARDLAAFTAAHGTLVFRHGSVQKTQPMWVDRTGKELGQFGEPGLYTLPQPSADGSLVGLVRPDPDTGKGDVWIVDTSRNTMSRSTFADASQHLLCIFSGREKDCGRHHCRHGHGRNVDPADQRFGQSGEVGDAKDASARHSWSPNGRYIFFMVQNNATRLDVYYFDLNGDRKLTPFLNRRPMKRRRSVAERQMAGVRVRRVGKVRSLCDRIPWSRRKIAGLQWWRRFPFVERGWQATLLQRRR